MNSINQQKPIRGNMISLFNYGHTFWWLTFHQNLERQTIGSESWSDVWDDIALIAQEVLEND